MQHGLALELSYTINMERPTQTIYKGEVERGRERRGEGDESIGFFDFFVDFSFMYIFE